MNQVACEKRYQEIERIEGMIHRNGNPGAILAAPGNYYSRLKIERDSVDVPFSIKPDPNYKVTPEEYEAQFVFLNQVKDKFNETQKAIKDIRSLRTQINSFIALQGKDVPKEVKQMADSINKQLTAI